VRGDVIDLRKNGCVPSVDDVQPAGIIHMMKIELDLEPDSLRMDRVAVDQPFVAVEASKATKGECCRDPAPRLVALAGETLDPGFTRRLAGAFGGPLGCSHLLTLFQLMASTVPRAIAFERDRAAREGRRPRRARASSAAASTSTGRSSPTGPSTSRSSSPTRIRVPPRRATAASSGWCASTRSNASPASSARASSSSASPCASDALARRRRRRALARPRRPRLDARRPSDDPRHGGADLQAARRRRDDAAGAGQPPAARPGLHPDHGGADGHTSSDAAPPEAIAAEPATPSVSGIGGMPDSCYMWRKDSPYALSRREAMLPR
jgi:hypothetical protein